MVDAAPGGVSAEARTWGMIAHFSALSGYVFPLGWIVGPLIVWALKKDEYPSVRENALEAMNFNITCFLAALLCIPLVFVCVGAVVLPAIGVAQIVFVIIGGIKAGEGQGRVYHYPWTIRLIR